MPIRRNAIETRSYIADKKYNDQRGSVCNFISAQFLRQRIQFKTLLRVL